ncbi:immunoglobulin superfamily member 3-like isoform X2 [Hypomesus transpacificus]|uniref:immunoglobulin superfamily member 3-like isoform X2 n=1 Tax=Hypomesus transpacificus TaxID=137520 RepID=UPI001F07AB81|nr:immunoglobulin superfamily member 3-like isoform X2 [Hypomesus transpacificus]
MILFGLIFLFYIKSVSTLEEDIFVQLDHVMVVRKGESVNLTCLRTYNKGVLWFKQIIGQKPVLIVTSYPTSFILNPKDWKPDTKHLNVIRGVNSCNLTITQTQLEDSATYYCAQVFGITFGDGTLLIVKEFEPKSRTILQHLVSESHKLGDSVTLNCKIPTEICSGEHSVYWFRHGSGESRPGILYTHGGRSDQCEKSPEAGSPTQSCVYNLPKRNLSLSDAGTYYCAVTSCGEILFGNGIKQDTQDGQNHPFLFILFCLMTTVSIMSVTVNIIVCSKIKRTRCDVCTEGPDTSDCQTEYRTASVSRAKFEKVSDDVDLNYSTLKFTDKKKTKPRRQKKTQSTLK